MRHFSSVSIAQSPSSLSVPPNAKLPGVTNDQGNFISIGHITLTVILLLTSILTGWQWLRSRRTIKQLQGEKIKQTDTLNQALQTLNEYRQSSDLKGAKILALDYLRMRLDEEVFRYQVIHQLEEHFTALVSQVVKSTLPETPTVKQILLDRRIDVKCDLEGLEEKWYNCTVLRIHVQLRKLPLQSSSNTVKQMVEAVTFFLNHPQGQSEWKTPLQDQWLGLRWESSNDPLPLLNLQNSPAKTKESKANRPHQAKDFSNPNPLSVLGQPAP
jgi:hypothetical protein